MKHSTSWVPILGTIKSYNRQMAKGDLGAGFTTAVMLVPQAMAYAMLAGLDPIVGLYASVVPLLVYSLFGTSRELAVGPVAMVSLLVASSVGAIAAQGSAEYLTLAIAMALLVGLIQTAMGVARLGFLVNLLSHPVLAGFTSAAALIIGFSQLKHLLGVAIPRSHQVHHIIMGAIERLNEANLYTVGIGFASVIALVVLKKVKPNFPRSLVVVVVGTLLVKFFGLSDHGVAIVGAVPAGLPAPSVPSVDGDMISLLLPMAIAISLVSYMESISVAKNFARKAKYEVDPNRELVGLGLANVAGSFFGAYPVTGGFSRTAVNAEAGSKSPVAAMITALVVALALVFFTPLFYFLPKSVLAGIIMAAVFGLIDLHEAKHLWKINRSDFFLMIVTFVATLSLGIELGILVGVGASMAWVFYKLSNPHVATLGRLPGTDIYRSIARNPDAVVLPSVLAVRIDAPLFFANALFLKSTLKKLESEKDDQICAVVLDARPVTDFDSSALAVFKELVEDYIARDVDVYIANTWGPIHDKLQLAGITDLLGKGHIVKEIREALLHLERVPCCEE